MVQLLILGEVCSRHCLATGTSFKVTIQRCSGYAQRIADIGDTGIRVFHQRPGHADFPGIHLRRPAAISSPCPSGSESGLSPLADEFPFEFRQRAEYMEYEFAAAGCCVHAFTEALKPNLAGSEAVHSLDEMLQRNGQAGPASRRSACRRRGHIRWLQPGPCVNRQRRWPHRGRSFRTRPFGERPPASLDSGRRWKPVHSRSAGATSLSQNSTRIRAFETLISRQVLQQLLNRFARPTDLGCQES